MSEKKTLGIGKGTPGPGRPKGIPNKQTTLARAAIAQFVDGNVERMQGWLDRIAEEEGPLAAFQCVERVLEYHVPKLQRSEITADVTHKVSLLDSLKAMRNK